MRGTTQTRNLDGLKADAVVYAGSLGGLAIARCLGKRGLRVVMISHHAYLRATRYAAGVKVANVQQAIELLRNYQGSQERRPVLLTDDDTFLDAVMTNWEAISHKFQCTFAKQNQCLWDKSLLDESARLAGVPVPKVWDKDECLGDLVFPVVVKPLERERLFSSWPSGARKAYECGDRETLCRTLDSLQRVGVNAVIQQLIHGDVRNLFCVTLYRNVHGHVIIGFVVRKLRQYPLEYGTGTVHITCDEPRVVDLSVQLLDAVNYVGVAMIEFKYDEAKDEFFLIEVNGRFPLETGIAGHLKTSFPYEVIQDIRQPVATRTVNDSPVTSTLWIHTLRDVVAVLQSGKSPLREYISYVGKYHMAGALWDTSDLRPVFGFYVYLGRKALKRKREKSLLNSPINEQA